MIAHMENIEKVSEAVKDQDPRPQKPEELHTDNSTKG